MAANKIISTGRGGAGNMRASQNDDDTEHDGGLPQIKGKIFTTGRGGKGNMMQNIDPQTTRAAQDEGNNLDFDRTDLAPTQSMTVGRGGYGNNIRAVNSGNNTNNNNNNNNSSSYSQNESSEDKSPSFCERVSNAFS